MATDKLLIAEFYLTGACLNELIKPVALKRYPSLQDLVFEVKHGTVYLTAAGKHLLLRFRVAAAFEITSLVFNLRSHRLEFNASYQVKPALINLLHVNPLAPILEGIPGVTVQGSRVTLDLDQNPHFNLLRQFNYCGEEILSLFELTWEDAGDRGLAFRLTLNRHLLPCGDLSSTSLREGDLQNNG